MLKWSRGPHFDQAAHHFDCYQVTATIAQDDGGGHKLMVLVGENVDTDRYGATTATFDRKADAEAWAEDFCRQLPPYVDDWLTIADSGGPVPPDLLDGLAAAGA